MLRGLTTRNYPLVTRSFAEAYGIEKSAISERFIQASREKLKTLMERPLSELRLCAIVIDGTPFKGRQMIAAIGVTHDGKKTVLGLREGATENAAVVRELLEDLARRGLDFLEFTGNFVDIFLLTCVSPYSTIHLHCNKANILHRQWRD